MDQVDVREGGKGEVRDEETGAMPNGRRYDFASMNVGDGMFCETIEQAKSVVSSAVYYAKKHAPGFKVARKGIHGGYRVWRIS